MKKLLFLIILSENIRALFATEKNVETLRNEALIHYYQYSLECIKEESDNEELSIIEDNQTLKNQEKKEFEKILDDLEHETIPSEILEPKKTSFIHSKLCKFFMISGVITAFGGVSYYCLRDHDIIDRIKTHITGA